MGWLQDPVTEIRDIQRRQRRNDQAERIARQITPEQVANIAKVTDWFPWLPSGVALGLAQANIDAESVEADQVAQQVAKDQANSVFGYAKPGDKVTAASMTQPQLDAARTGFTAIARAQGAMRQASELGFRSKLQGQASGGGVFGDAAQQALDDPAVFQRRMALDRQGGGGLLGQVSGINDVINPAGAITRGAGAVGAELSGGVGPSWLRDNPITDTAQRIIDSGPAAQAGAALKGTSRVAVAAMDTPRQIVQGQYRTSMQNIREKGVLRGVAESFIANPDQARDVWMQTDLGQAQAQAQLQGRVDMGSGFFTGTDSQVARDRRSAEARFGGTLENGQVRTIGRDFAGVFFEPGTQGFDIVSGLGDAAVAIGVDAAAVNPVQDLAGANRAFQTTAGVTEATTATGRAWETSMGLIRGTRKTYSPEMVDAWLSSGTGRRVIDRIASTESISELDAMTRRQLSPSLLRTLVDETDPQVIRSILDDNLGLTVRNAPISHLRGRVGQLGFGFKDSLPQPLSRWTAKLPTRGMVDLEDPRGVLSEVERRLQNVNAPRESIDRFMREMTDAPSRTSRAAVFRAIEADTQTRLLTEVGASEKRARELTRLYQDHLDSESIYNINALGDSVTTFGAVIDGKKIVGPEPHLLTEHVSRYMPGVDVRGQRRAFSSPWVKAIIGDEQLRTPISAMLALQENVWKPTALLRFAFPVRVIGEEQARIAASGLDSAFRHPMSYMGFLLGDEGRVSRWLSRWGVDGKAAEDVFGEVMRGLDEHAGAMAKASSIGLGGEANQRLAGMAVFRRGEDGFEAALADELATLAADPVAQMVSRIYASDIPENAIGNPLLRAQEAFASDQFKFIREELAAAHPGAQLADLTTRRGQDFYIETIARRIREKTRDVPELLDAVRTGRINGVALFDPGTPFISKAAVGEIGKFADVGPDIVRGPRYKSVRNAGDSFAALDKAVDTAFGYLFTKPDNYLSRSPAWRQFYTQHITALAPKLDPAQIDDLVKWGTDQNLDATTLKTLRGRAGSAAGDTPLSLEAINELAKGYALDDTKNLLFDLSDRGQFFDTFRLVFPFGEAWGEMLKSWGKIFTTRPKALLTTKRILEGGRSETVGDLTGAPEGQGFFYRNEFGDEVFGYPLSGQLLQLLGGPPVPMTGRLQGLTMGAEVVPGIGPVAQIPLAALIPDAPAWDGVNDLLFPFGRPDKPGSPVSAVEGMLPAWARTLFERGLTAGGVTSEGQRAYGNTTIDVMRYLASTGQYQVAGSPESRQELTRLVEDSKRQASWMTVLRGIAQSAAPSSPIYEWYIDTPDGKKLPMLTMVADYRSMQEEDFETATQRFLDKYGDNAFLLMQGKSVSISAGILPPTTEANDWLRDNMWSRSLFPTTYGFFAPQGGDFSSQAYQRQLELQERNPLTPEQFVRAGNDMIATSMYYTERDAMMAEALAAGRKSLDDGQQAYMRDLDDWLRTNYEGYGDSAGRLGRATPEEMIDELTAAVDDKRLKDLPISKSIREYLAERDWVRAESKAQLDSENSYQSAAGGTVYRQHLEAFAESLIADDPDFALVWERVFRSEMREGIQKDTQGEEK